LLVAGGSSAGGAYQNKDDPEASFVVQAHNQLCEDLPLGVALRTHNYARGNRDTFTISRTIETMLDKTGVDVVLLYVGVNDLLADHHSMTRKQRETQRMERSAALRGVAGMARRLRLVTGFWLATRELPDAHAPAVSDVPLPDAVENFGRIADVTAAAGARLILMTEHMRAEQAGRLDDYRQAQVALAASREGVDFLDVRPAFEGASDDQVLVDQNHLTREGGERLGKRLAAAVGPVLWTQGSSR
jgi:lysophospholipase L1-like esterase